MGPELHWPKTAQGVNMSIEVPRHGCHIIIARLTELCPASWHHCCHLAPVSLSQYLWSFLAIAQHTVRKQQVHPKTKDYYH